MMEDFVAICHSFSNCRTEWNLYASSCVCLGFCLNYRRRMFLPHFSFPLSPSSTPRQAQVFYICLSSSSVCKQSVCNAGDSGLHDCVGKIPWKRSWQPRPVSLPGQRHLVGYTPQGHKESDTTKVTEHACTLNNKRSYSGYMLSIINNSLQELVNWI